MAGKLRFISDGVHEIGRKFKRRKLRSRQRALEHQREEALLRLGRRAWEAKIDLTAYSDLRDKLQLLDDRAGRLTARTSELQAQSDALQSERKAEITRFDELSRPVLKEKEETDTALRTARARVTENERAIAGLQGRLKWLTDELARPAQAAASGQRSRESLLAEQKGTSNQIAAAARVREGLAAEVNRLTGESQRLADHLSRIETDRKSIVAPIDAKLEQAQQESKGATREISDVGREQTDCFTRLGAALYRQKEAHPALQECRQAVEAIDEDRAEVKAALDASVNLTLAMPRWTMLKFTAVPLLLVVLGLGFLLAVYSLSGESSGTGPLQYIARHIKGSVGEVADSSVTAEESRKDEIVRAFLRSPDEELKRRDAVQILENDLVNVGSTADRSYLPYLIKILRRGEPELRAAAGNSIGMIGPAASELPVLLEALNDPVPGVRDAALAALQQVREDARIRLLVRRVQVGASQSGRDRERFRAEPAPDSRSLGVPIYEGATFLHYASDPGIGRAAFVTDAPVQKVVDFYRSRSGRPALGADEFTRAYLGGTPQDPTGAKRIALESEASLKRAVQAGKLEAEIRLEMEKYAALMQSLPQARYMDSEVYGAPTFVALEDSAPAGKTIRYVAVFEDRALGKTGFEVHGATAR